jgi:hypothetical protein
MPPIRHILLPTLLLLTLATAPAQAQTVKALSFNTTNGVVLGPTNLTFTNPVQFSAITFTNSIIAPDTSDEAIRISAHILKAAAWNDGGSQFSGALEINNGQDFATRIAPAPVINEVGVDLVLPSTSGTLALAGITTNIAVLVSGGGTNTLQFSNGVLTNVTTP